MTHFIEHNLQSRNSYSTALPMLKLHELPNLQMAIPIRENDNLEIDFFSKHLHDEYNTETNLELPESLEELATRLRGLQLDSTPFRTDNAGLSFLRTLAQLHFRNEPFPEEWRIYCQEANKITVGYETK